MMSGNNEKDYKYYSKSYSGGYASSGSGHSGDRKRIGNSLNFASREAYKQLRTNLDFALSGVHGCRCVGITSPVRGDGKSLTAINLSYALAEDGYRVILLEGDMRIPTLGRKLGVKQAAGLSNILSDGSKLESINTLCLTEESKGFLDILTAGDIPPNPQELLGSDRMTEFIEFLKTIYDYVILDLPPVTIVADALVASKVIDGMLLIVRHNHTERGALAEAIRQIEFGGIKILGFIFNAANNDDAGYSRRYKYKYRYYKGYRNGYYGNTYGYESVKKDNDSDRYTHTSDTGNR